MARTGDSNTKLQLIKNRQHRNVQQYIRYMHKSETIKNQNQIGVITWIQNDKVQREISSLKFTGVSSKSHCSLRLGELSTQQ